MSEPILIDIDEARDKARDMLRRIRAGQAPVEPVPDKPQSVKKVCEDWYDRVVVKEQHRTTVEARRHLDKYILPVWKDRDFTSLKRSDLAKLLDAIEDESGSRTADLVAARIKAIARWYASRTDHFTNPFFGTNTTRHKKPARSRILNDDEIKALWLACPDCGRFGDLLKLCLLTAQRVSKVLTMKWSDLDGNEWVIDTVEREKGNGIALVLPEVALKIINRQPRMMSNDHVFSGRRGKAMSIATMRYRLADKLPIKGWVIHDLRRTARSLLSRCGVRPEVSERLIGHAIKGVEKIYDRHSYRDEKADALRRLTGLIDTIVRDDRKVIRMTGKKVSGVR